MATKADRYEGIDGLKAYAIIGIALMHVLSNGELGGNVLTMLFFCVAALVYTLGCNRGGTGQSGCQVPRWYQLRDLSVPHGNLSCT